MPDVTPFLTFERDGARAVRFYQSVFPDMEVDALLTDAETGQLYHAAFRLGGQRFMAMDAGPEFGFSLGVSLFVNCSDQAEIDHYWDALSSEGGEEGQCGWLKDQFGLSWQIVPEQLGTLLQNPDPACAQRVAEAMLQMTRLDIAKLEAAARPIGRP